MTTLLTPIVDVLVIGAGQAGLALGQQLQQTGLSFLIVDRHARVGDSWRQRFDSLTLFTPRSYSGLPGMPVSGDPEGYADKDEIADYLESYAQRFSMPLALSTDRPTRAQRWSLCRDDERRRGTKRPRRGAGDRRFPATGCSSTEQATHIWRRATDPGKLPESCADARRDGASGR